jgi:hypothetical protein
MTFNYTINLGRFPELPGVNPVCDDNYFLRSFEQGTPPRSECAFIAKRALSWAPWLSGLSNARKQSFLDRHNLEFSHQHIFIGDSSANIGWGEKGLFSEPFDKSRYHVDPFCYDGEAMRRAISSLQNLARYNPFTNNCQKFIENILHQYKEIIEHRGK